MEITTQDIYRIVFKGYPDVLDVKQVGEILCVSTKTVYRLIRNGSIASLKVGREFRIPKVNLMQYTRLIGTQTASRPTG